VIQLSDFNKNILICVTIMNESLSGLDQHEGENKQGEYSFLEELSF